MKGGGFYLYKKSKQKARYKQLAQKYDQLFSKLNEDSNTQVRWIWQLIQNAKDVPNKFGKVKIKIVVNDKSMSFCHNGDPFNPSDLQSIVGQYSQKTQANSEEVQTTGKYGTGFVTTYMISKKIKISGILFVIKGQDFDSDDQQSQDDSQDSSSSQQEIEKQSSQSKSKTMPKSQNKNQMQAHSQYFSRFDIILDRKYKDRDNDFIRKLRKNQEKVMKTLEQLDNKQPWKRSEDDYDTSFTYLKLDQTSFQMIDLGINSLKQLFPYALLFNKKLFEIKVEDCRTQKKFQNFTITKDEEFKLKSMNIFTFFTRQNQRTQVKYLAYKTDPYSKSIIAIPIQIEKQRIKLLTLKNQTPKVFKEFPLIGARDTGYNFVFTSRNFYPDQSRSNLLLNKSYGREDKRVSSNWESLENIFKLYKIVLAQLAEIINDGRQNFLNIYQTPFLGNHDKYFSQKFKQIIQKQIPNLNIVNFKNGTLGKLRDLIFIQDTVSQNYQQNCEASNHINQVFQFLHKNNKTLDSQTHKKWYSNLMKRQRKYLQKVISYQNIDDSLESIGRNGYDFLIQKLESHEKVEEKMYQIYKLLKVYRKKYLNKQQTPIYHQIVLTNNRQLKTLKRDGYLKVKKNLPNIYQKICQTFSIDIDSYLIHDKLADYFENVPSFSINQANAEIEQFFEVQKIVNPKVSFKIQTYRKTHQFFRYLKTLEICQTFIEIVQEINQFSDVQKYNFDLTQFKKLDSKISQTYSKAAQTLIILKIQQITKPGQSVMQLSNKLKNFKGNVSKTITWFNKALSLQVIRKAIKSNISWDLYLRQYDKLNYIDYYPDEIDVKFYQQMRPKHSNIYRKQKPALKALLIHPDIMIRDLKYGTNYQSLFRFAESLFAHLNVNQKNYFLKYIEKIEDQIQAERQKFENTKNQKQKLFKKQNNGEVKLTTEQARQMKDLQVEHLNVLEYKKGKLSTFEIILTERHKILFEQGRFSASQKNALYHFIKHKDRLIGYYELDHKYSMKEIVQTMKSLQNDLLQDEEDN